MKENTPVLESVTCVMSIYINDRYRWVKDAINSILNGTRLPGEFLICCDGPVSSDIDKLLNKYVENAAPLVKVFKYTKNQGRAYARQYLINMAKGKYIMIMDADDISLPDRLEKQYEIISSDCTLDVVGGWIEEFDGSSETRVRKVPVGEKDIRRRGKFLQPLNHVTILAKKEVFFDVGGYQDVGACEDYYLIARWLVAGKNLKNIPEILVSVRASDEFLSRRRGINYYSDEMVVYRYFKAEGYISVWEYMFISSTKLILRMLPRSLLSSIYRFSRSQ